MLALLLALVSACLTCILLPGTAAAAEAEDVICDGATEPDAAAATPPVELEALTGELNEAGVELDFSGTEHVEEYRIEISIDDSGGATFVETIDYDFGDFAVNRHGIYRDLITIQRCNDRYDRVYPLTVISVESETAPDGYVLETWEHGDRIKIGDANRTVTGRHKYVITYRLDGILNGFPTHDELYWNVVGDGWSVPIGNLRVIVRAPESPEQVACFSGYSGSRSSCSDASIREGRPDDRARFDQNVLWPQQMLTVVVALPKGAVAEPEMILDERFSLARAFEVTPATVAATGALTIAILGIWGLIAFRVGRDRQVSGSHVDVAFAPVGSVGGPVGLFEDQHSPVEFVPPDELRPGQVGVLVDEVAHPVDVTATIVDLAVRGYIRIEEIPEGRRPDYRIVRLDKDFSELLGYERMLLERLVTVAEGSVKLSDLKYSFATDFRNVVDAMYDEVVQRGWYARRPDSTRHRWLGLGILAVLVSIAVLVVLVVFTHYALLGIPLVIGSTLLLISSRWMPRRTPAGTGLLRRARGFEVFIRDSEAPRARWAEQKNIFSEYLPYAIVFRCADRWARTFEDLGAEAIAESGGWYVGSHPFSSFALTSAMDDFTSSAGSTLSTPAPSTSGSSGSSGFSGGSSGGGGGGGGGGSW